MNARWIRSSLFTLAVVAAAGVAGCSETADPAALGPDAPSLASTGPVLIECPVSETTFTTGSIGAKGGSVRLHNHELRVPALAVTTPKEFRVEAAASNYMELGVHAAGHASFQFKRTASITIDYSRCTRDNIDHYQLSVWQIDPVTKELIEFMGGVDDKDARTITFETNHLSTFSIAR